VNAHVSLHDCRSDRPRRQPAARYQTNLAAPVDWRRPPHEPATNADTQPPWHYLPGTVRPLRVTIETRKTDL